MNTAELRLHIDAYLNLRGSLGWQTEIIARHSRNQMVMAFSVPV